LFTDYRLRQREYLLDISKAMTARLELPSLLKLILESAVELLGGKAGLIVLKRDDGDYYPRASYGLPVKMIELLHPLWRDLPRNPVADRTLWQSIDFSMRLQLASASIGIPLRQVIALPLALAEEAIGFIYIFRSHGAEFSLDDRQLLQSFADQAAIAVQNARLYQESKAERASLNAIIENSGDGIMIITPERMIKTWNRALAALTGLSTDEVIGRPCFEV
jgi:GAF domain-containing protein